MNSEQTSNSGPKRSPHLTAVEIREKLLALETAEGQDRVDLMTELAWRPAWAIRSRHGVWRLLSQWYRGWRRRLASHKSGSGSIGRSG